MYLKLMDTVVLNFSAFQFWGNSTTSRHSSIVKINLLMFIKHSATMVMSNIKKPMRKWVNLAI